MRSILDTDLYKLTMGQAVQALFPRARAKYRFVNRNRQQKFTTAIRDAILDDIENMASLKLTDDEHRFLREACPYLTPGYVDWLRQFRFNPDQVDLDLKSNEGGEDVQLVLTIDGPWFETIYWEVPLLAAITKQIMHAQTGLVDAVSAEKKAREKAEILHENDCKFADFGTRRRFDNFIHEIVLQQLIDHGKEHFIGTSNVHYAHEYGVKPIGTMAHEWIQAISGLVGLRHANRFALEAWNKVYQGRLGIALTDTFGSEAFWRDFDGVYARLFDGVRQDSGDPLEFMVRAINHYKSLGIDPMSKTIIFSDSLNVDKARLYRQEAEGLIKCAFGIGTNLTNDVTGTTPANVVIKMVQIDHVPVVKLSDDPGKAIGDSTAIDVAKWTFGIKE